VEDQVEVTDDQIRDVMTRALEYGVSEPVEVARLVVDEFVGEAAIGELIREQPGMTEEQALNGLLTDVARRVERLDAADREGPPSPPAVPPM
jgi:hypothetical protein